MFCWNEWSTLFSNGASISVHYTNKVNTDDGISVKEIDGTDYNIYHQGLVSDIDKDIGISSNEHSDENDIPSITCKMCSIDCNSGDGS